MPYLASSPLSQPVKTQSQSFPFALSLTLARPHQTPYLSSMPLAQTSCSGPLFPAGMPSWGCPYPSAVLVTIIAVDFVTGLPPSNGNTVVLTIIDRFSKSVHFVRLQKLPSTARKGDLLVRDVFRLQWIPRNIQSDRGLQFTSGVWKSICTALGASVSLSCS